jgi:predicted nucleic acid-binding protein
MVYADTSLLASLILEDSNSGAATALVRDFKGSLVWTDFLKLELHNAIRLRVEEKRLTEANAETGSRLAERLVASRKWERQEPDWPRVLARANGLSAAHAATTKARSLDIMHVASAMECGVKEFWTFDKRQRALALAVGLRVNP